MPNSNRKKKLLVFLSHANEDKPTIRELCQHLKDDGFDPWLDEERILPGQNWQLEIEQALRNSDAVLVSFSKKSLVKEGYIQREYKKALDYQMEKPVGTIFVIPVRLDNCDIPFFLQELQYVDYPLGYEKLVKSLSVRAGKSTSTKKSPKTQITDITIVRADESKRDAKQVQIVLEGTFEAFNETRQEDLISILASMLRVDTESIRILQVYSGSIIVVMEMPRIATNRLIKFATKRDFRLKAQRIVSIQVEGKPAISLSDVQFTPQTIQIDVKGGKPQIAIGEGARNIQAQTYIEKLIIMRPKTVAPTSLNQLPSPPADFKGREREIEQILADVENLKGATINGLTGLGGIGKTALGLIIAHKLENKYRDGQIFLDLKGTTKPLATLNIIRHIILSFEPNTNLSDLDENSMAAVYQSVLHNKKVLIFLDNAHSAEQIALLIPPVSCFLLITSRWVFNLPGLRNYSVAVLAENDAKDFLLTLCPRIGDKADEIAQACGYLPLALRIAGSFLQVNENWYVDKYLALLNDVKHRMATIETSWKQIDLGKDLSLIATFDLSYQQLEENEQGLWQMLSTFQHSFNWQETAGLWEKDEDTTVKLLGRFRRYSLIDYNEVTKTYKLHDLLVNYGLWQIEQAIIISKQNNNFHDELKWMMLLALASKNASNFREAIDLYKQALTITREVTERQVEATILNGLGILYREIGEHNQSIESHEKALIIAEAIGNHRKELSALTGLGNEYHSLGESHRAIEYLEKASALAEQIGDQSIEAKLLNNLGNSYEDFDPLRAIELFEKALIISQEVGDRLTQGNVLTNAGIAYRETGNISKALEYQKRAQVIFQEIKDLDGEGAAFNNAGNCYLDLGQINDAIDCFRKLLAISQKTFYRNGEADALGNLGRAYSALGKLDEAQEYLEKQLRITQEINYRMGEGSSLDEIGILYISRNQPDRAISYIEKALAIFREINDKSGEGYALWNLGKVNKTKGDLEKAKLLGNQALQILEPIKSHDVPRIKKWLSELESAT